MAKSKKTAKVDIKSQVKRAEFIVGTSTLIIAVVLLGLALNGRNALGFFKSFTQPKAVVKVVDTQIQKEVSPSPTPAVSKLSYTDSGQQYAQVRRGDSYGRIAKRYCGNPRLYLYLSELNGNRDLHPGDTILVSCY